MNVYKKCDNHFSDVSAKAIVKDGVQVGKIAIKYMKSGVVHVYLHSFGHTMIYGKASGYGYDKVGASLRVAVESYPPNEEMPELYKSLKDVTYDGQWERLLGRAGFDVFNVL